jgi:hypothetical protein
MANGNIIRNSGRKVLLYRGYTITANLSATQYLAPTKFKVGVDNTTPLVGDTENLDVPIPISNGTVNDDCNSAFTGSNGGDNSTNNTSVYKEGGGVTDVTAQNLRTTGSNVNKTWTKTVDSNFTAARYAGFWLYILDATALAKFKSSGAALTARWRTDASNYYQKTWTAAELSTGWNWLHTGSSLISALTAVGTPGALSEFYINIETNNAADAFVAGDVVIDLVRTWQASNLIASFVAGYPSLDLTNHEVTTRMFLGTNDANGYDIDGVGTFNEDSSPLMLTEATINPISKSSTDEIAFVFKERLL